jgi:hypothetical protein
VTQVPANILGSGVEAALPVADASCNPNTLNSPPGATDEVKEAPFDVPFTDGGPEALEVIVTLTVPVAPL